MIREHRAAVKAIDWCSWQSNLLATGGGKIDGSIKIWNVYNGAKIKDLVCNDQVSGILWSDKNRELMSSHGDTKGKLTIWKYPSLVEIGRLEGHLDRILSIVASPNGEIVASLSADQTLRFWTCFKTDKKMTENGCSSPITTRALSRSQTIR